MLYLPDPAISRAVLIGVAAYEHLPQLPAVTNNVQDLATLLQASDIWGIAPEHCIQMTKPEQVTLDAVVTGLQNAAAQAEDTLMIYYAGHGRPHPRDPDKLYLTLPGAETQDRSHLALDYEHIRDVLLDPKSSAKRKVVILDCCWSGRILDGAMAASNGVILESTAVDGTFVLTATVATRTAKAPEGAQYTAFTGALIELLTQGLSDGPQLLDLHTIYREISRRLRERGLPRPDQRSRLNGGDIAIALNRAVAVRNPQLGPGHIHIGNGDIGREIQRLRRSGRFKEARDLLIRQAANGNSDARDEAIKQRRRAGAFREAIRPDP